MASFKLYTDAALTTEFSGPLQVTHNSDLSDNPQDFQLFIGSLTAGVKIQASSDPGIDNIILAVSDSAGGGGHEATEIRLATTQLGLDGASDGANLTVGTEVLSEAAGAFEFWIRITNAVVTPGVSTELSIATNSITELVQ